VSAVLLYAGVLASHVIQFGFVFALMNAWDRDVAEFFLMGVAVFGIGLMGEYIGRIYEQVRGRPRFLVAGVLEKPELAREASARR
jgi:undecaprenyl-phosphate 4-deoxy-4-formamido-L-arabinose transferase